MLPAGPCVHRKVIHSGYSSESSQTTPTIPRPKNWFPLEPRDLRNSTMMGVNDISRKELLIR